MSICCSKPGKSFFVFFFFFPTNFQDDTQLVLFLKYHFALSFIFLDISKKLLYCAISNSSYMALSRVPVTDFPCEP